MKDVTIVLVSAATTAAVSIWGIASQLVSANVDLASSLKVSPFVTILGVAILSFKPILVGICTGVAVFLVLGFAQVLSRQISKK